MTEEKTLSCIKSLKFYSWWVFKGILWGTESSEHFCSMTVRYNTIPTTDTNLQKKQDGKTLPTLSPKRLYFDATWEWTDVKSGSKAKFRMHFSRSTSQMLSINQFLEHKLVHFPFSSKALSHKQMQSRIKIISFYLVVGNACEICTCASKKNPPYFNFS